MKTYVAEVCVDSLFDENTRKLLPSKTPESNRPLKKSYLMIHLKVNKDIPSRKFA
jgi:hypothetical protein